MTGKARKRILAILMTVVCVLGMLVMPDAGRAQAAGGVAISGRAHVQTFGDQNGKLQNQNGIQTLVLGTRGLAKRVEYVRYVRDGDRYYKYKVENGELGELLQIYDMYFDSVE